ncbi:MAG: zinc-dependent alcohol dehydrogenase family protein [Alphaproteobacteria bacterium]|jgi:2-desacetyl-2-hydroxyethyl bacteriochlorophyllide A dehydrogenase
MKGVVFTGDRQLELREFPDPTPGPEDVVLEIKASGMCGSDLHQYRAPPSPGGAVAGGVKRMEGVIAGHEPCGVVVAVGSSVSERQARIGQRVMDHHYDGCGGCKHCQGGWSQMCLDGTTVYGSGAHGAHAKYMLVPAHTVVPLPDELSYETGAAISCGTGTAWGALQRLQLQGGETIAIFGQGPVGLSATQLAVAMGARVIALDVSEERRQLATQFGADIVIDALANDPVEAIRELTHGEGAHKTLDCSSAPTARQAAVKAVRSWGTACFVGERGMVEFDVSNDILRRQVTLVGSWTFSKQGQAACAEFVADNKIDVDHLFSHRWKLDQAEEAYKLFDTQTTGKGVIDPS